MEARVRKIFDALRAAYPDAGCELKFGTPFQLLVAVILSAQCTDRRVNKVTEKLFAEFKTPEDFAAMDIDALRAFIKPCGFFNVKARHIKAAAAAVVDRFGGRVPDNVADLTTLDGVGRKSANVVYSVAFKGRAIAVDTHVFRTANRLGLAKANNVSRTEKQLTAALEPELYSEAHHLLIFLGRYTCKARRPLCGECAVGDMCRYFAERAGSVPERF